MQAHAPSRSLSRLLPLVLVLAGPFGARSVAFGQSNVRPAPVVDRVPRAANGPRVDSRGAVEARYLRLYDEPAVAPPRWDVEMELGGELLPAADLETGGERSVLRGGWEALLRRDAGDRSLALFLDAEASFYDWSTTAPVVAGVDDPFNDLYTTRLGALATFAEDDEVSWFTGMEIALSGEDDASIGDAISVGAVTGCDVRASRDLTLSFGLAALTRLEDQAWVLPYFGFDWRLNEHLRVATEGASLLAEARLSDAWTATLRGEYELRQFRLNDDGAIPGGVYQDDQINLTGELAWRFADHATLSVTGGLAAWQESTFLDGAGERLGQVETDPGLYGAVGLAFGN